MFSSRNNAKSPTIVLTHLFFGISLPFKTGAIEVSIATMCKGERCYTDEIYVVGFVPSYLLPRKRSILLGPFLDPLIREIEGGFIRGNCHFILSCISTLLVNKTIHATALMVYYFFMLTSVYNHIGIDNLPVALQYAVLLMHARKGELSNEIER